MLISRHTLNVPSQVAMQTNPCQPVRPWPWRNALHRILLTIFAGLIFIQPAALLADDRLAVLEKVSAANSAAQPGLESYLVTVETSRIAEMIDRMTAGMVADVPRPKPPEITKYWMRNGEGGIVAGPEPLQPYVAQMVDRISAHLAVELNRLLLPADRAAQRRSLTAAATVKSSQVALDQDLLQRMEITFEPAADLDAAFYATGMRLPQKGVKTLVFDIDVRTGVVNEMMIYLDDGLKLTVEIRYFDTPGSKLPERFRVTSPDGKIDDLFEVQMMQVAGYHLPKSMRRILRRPDIQEDIEIHFRNYRINQPIPEAIRAKAAKNRQE